jgi:hypothetical protein
VSSSKLQITVSSGTSDRSRIELVPGTPVEPFSVGSSGSWVVSAAGVAPVHAYLSFNGKTVFVASAPGSSVRAGGAVIGTDWKELAPPCEIELGSARLRLEDPSQAAAPKAAEPVDYDDDAPTQYQPVPAEFQAAALAALPAPPAAPAGRPRPPSEPPQSDRTRVMPPREESAPVSERTRVLAREEPSAPRAERPKPPSVPNMDAATVVKPLDEFLGQRGLGEGGDPDTHKRPLAAPLPAAGAPPPGAAGVIIAPAEATQPPGTYGAPQQMAPQGYGYPQQQQQGYPGYGQQQYPQQGYPGQMSGATPQGMWTGGVPGPQPAAKGGPLADLVQTWKTASIPRKITFALAPLALIGFFIIFFAKGEEPEPQGRKEGEPAPSGSAPDPSAKAATGPSAVAPTASGEEPEAPPEPTSTGQTKPAEPDKPDKPDKPEKTAGVEPQPQPPVTAQTAEPEQPVKLKKGEITKERAAVDAAARNDYAKAAELYDELAKENPDNPVFSAASKIMKAKARRR